MYKFIKERGIIILVGIPAWLYLIWLGGFYYSIFILCVAILGLQEFYILTGKTYPDIFKFIGFAISGLIIYYFHFQLELISFHLISFLILIIILLFMSILFIPLENISGNIGLFLKGILYVPVLLGTAVAIRQYDLKMDTNITFAITASVWSCDAAAFVFGTFWGNRKIFPRVSPNKSWLGSISGFIASIIVFFLFYFTDTLGNNFTMWSVLIMGFIVGVFGQIGDFYESMLKRVAGVKDSGTILMGHGGVLDRFDSIIFATPIVFIYLHTLF